MTRAMNKGKLFLILLVAGIVLVTAGLIIQTTITSNESFQQLNEFMVNYGLGRMTPERVGETVREGITLFGTHYSLYEALTSLGVTAADAAQTITAANAYALSPVMINAGIISLIAAAVMFFLGKRR